MLVDVFRVDVLVDVFRVDVLVDVFVLLCSLVLYAVVLVDVFSC